MESKRANFSIARCALTSLAIQEPGISKCCSVCGREYLRESRPCPVDGDDGMSATQGMDLSAALQNSPLAQELLQKFDVCVHCNGKFVDTYS